MTDSIRTVCLSCQDSTALFTSESYVPVLTGREGELKAIGGLGDAVRMGFTPLLDVPPIPRPFPTAPGARVQQSRPLKVPARELDVLIERLRLHWGTSRRVIVDLDGFERYRLDGMHPVSYFVEKARQAGLLVTVSVSSRSTGDYRSAVRDLRLTGDQVVLRMHVGHGPTLEVDLAEYARLVSDIGAQAQVADLVIDLGRFNVSPAPSAEHVADQVKAVFAHRRIRTVALASSSLPDFSKQKSGTFSRRDRSDWLLWQGVRDRVRFPLAFSDYGITGPRRDDDEPARGSAPHLRYSHGETVYIWKGLGSKSDEAVERGMSYPDLCRKLLDYRVSRRLVFRGKTFSPGDDAMWETAKSVRGPGGPSQWVEYATSHHLKHVVTQLEAPE